MHILIVKNIAKKFSSKLVLSDVSFKIPQGRFVGLLGHNGSGKSTLVHCICGLVQPDQGHIYLFNKNIKKNVRFVRKRIGVLLQDNVFSSTERVIDVIMNHVGYFDFPRHRYLDTARRYLNMFHLWSVRNQSIQSLSGGMKRIVAIIRTIITQPEFLILDEPTVGIDIESRIIIWKLFEELNRCGTTILLISHNPQEVETLCNEIIVLKTGCVLKHSSIKALFQDKVLSYLIKLQIKVDSLKAYNIGNYSKVSENELIVHETDQQSLTVLLAPFFNHEIPIAKIEPVRIGKDEIIMQILKGKEG